MLLFIPSILILFSGFWIHQTISTTQVNRIYNPRLCQAHPKICLTSFHKIEQFRNGQENKIECEVPIVPFNGNCSSLIIILDEFDNEMDQIVRTTDNDPSIRRISFHFNATSLLNMNLNLIGSRLDDILESRPWWQILIEPQASSKRGHGIITLERYNHEWENHFKYLSGIQYPSSENCAKSTMVVSRNNCIHPGWGTVTIYFFMVRRSVPYAIFYPYYPELKEEHKINAFMRPSDCNGTNLWACAFLKSSNCSIPKVIVDCKKKECVEQESKHFMYSMVFQSATTEGALIDTSRMSEHEARKKVGELPFSHQKEFKTTQAPPFKYELPYDRSILKYYTQKDSTFETFLYRFLLRPTYFYRSKMNKLIQSFRESMSPPLYPSSSCTTVHIRRGDRVLYGINMSQWCHNVTHHGLCQSEDKNQLNKCGDNDGGDFGCKTVPFGSITIDDIVSKVPLLLGPGPQKRNIIIFSDDPVWVEEQIKNYKIIHPEWTLYSFSSLKYSSDVIDHKSSSVEIAKKGYYKLRYAAETDSGVYFHASLKLAQQCDAMIGHIGSAVTQMFHAVMCIQHGHKKGVCPPMYNLEWMRHEKKYS
eukprot:gene13039-17475_t